MSAVARTRVKALPSVWIAPLAGVMADSDNESVAAAVSVVRAAPTSKDAPPVLQPELLKVARDTARPIEVRLDAIAAVQPLPASISPASSNSCAPEWNLGARLTVRSTAAGILEKATLDRAQLMSLTSSLRNAGPLELPRLIRAVRHRATNRRHRDGPGVEPRHRPFERPRRGSPSILSKYPERCGRTARRCLSRCPPIRRIRFGGSRTLLPTFREATLLVARRCSIAPKAPATRATRSATWAAASAPTSRALARSAANATCSRPSSSRVPASRAATNRWSSGRASGEVHSGILRNNDLPDEVVRRHDRDETRIPRRDIVDMQPGTVSLMPQGLTDQLTRQELADLLAFLKATRSGA